MFPTMVELGKDTSMDVLREIWSGFSGVLDIAIPRTDAFAQASWEGRPLSYLGGKIRPEARRFNMLATEVEQRIRELAIERGEDDERPQRELV
jgi:chromosome partitioning protein